MQPLQLKGFRHKCAALLFSAVTCCWHSLQCAGNSILRPDAVMQNPCHECIADGVQYEQGSRHWTHACTPETENSSFGSMRPGKQSNELDVRSPDQSMRMHRNASLAEAFARRSAEEARLSTEEARLSAENACNTTTAAPVDARKRSVDETEQQKWLQQTEQALDAQPLSRRSQSMPDAVAGFLTGSRKGSITWQRSALYSILTEKAPSPPEQDLHEQ